MTQYQSTTAKTAYEVAHAAWVGADPVDRGEEPQPPPTYNSHVVDGPSEIIEARSGHMIATMGDYIFESTSEWDDRFVVHPNDATNANLWAQV